MNDLEQSIQRIKIVKQALGELSQQFIFIGGATIGLYVTRKEIDNARPTKDIDILVETYSLKEYDDIEIALRKKGFANDIESEVICRWILKGVQPITVDIMYPNPKKFGFTNKWYKHGIENAINLQLDKVNTIRLFSAVYFVASKIDAYNHRGDEDCRFDNDFSDIVYIIGNRESFLEELKGSKEDVKSFIVEGIRQLLVKDIEECISALGPDIGGAEGAARTYESMQAIAGL